MCALSARLGRPGGESTTLLLLTSISRSNLHALARPSLQDQTSTVLSVYAPLSSVSSSSAAMSFLRSSRASSASQSSTSLPTVKTVLQEPTLVKPPPRPARPEGEQKDKYDAILAHFSATDLKLPIGEGKSATEEGLRRGERLWLTEDCFLRYLRANNWVLQRTSSSGRVSCLWEWVLTVPSGSETSQTPSPSSRALSSGGARTGSRTTMEARAKEAG